MENKNKVHKILVKSYLFYFTFFLVGIILDYLFPMKIFQNSMIEFIGFVLMALATLLIFWAQKTTRNLDKENLTKNTFMCGPYKYTRLPTHWGLSFLIFGFGLTINAFFVVVTTIISYFFTKFFILKKEENILIRKYGEPYLEYKKSVSL